MTRRRRLSVLVASLALVAATATGCQSHTGSGVSGGVNSAAVPGCSWPADPSVCEVDHATSFG